MNRVVHIVSGRIDSGSQIGRFDGRMVGVAPFADELVGGPDVFSLWGSPKPCLLLYFSHNVYRLPFAGLGYGAERQPRPFRGSGSPPHLP